MQNLHIKHKKFHELKKLTEIDITHQLVLKESYQSHSIKQKKNYNFD